MKTRIVIFGTGSVSSYILNYLDSEIVDILAFSNTDINCDEFGSYPCIRPDKIRNFDYDYVLIASGYVETISELLNCCGVPKSKIVSFIYDERDVRLSSRSIA